MALATFGTQLNSRTLQEMDVYQGDPAAEFMALINGTRVLPNGETVGVDILEVLPEEVHGCQGMPDMLAAVLRQDRMTEDEAYEWIMKIMNVLHGKEERPVSAMLVQVIAKLLADVTDLSKIDEKYAPLKLRIMEGFAENFAISNITDLYYFTDNLLEPVLAGLRTIVGGEQGFTLEDLQYWATNQGFLPELRNNTVVRPDSLDMIKTSHLTNLASYYVAIFYNIATLLYQEGKISGTDILQFLAHYLHRLKPLIPQNTFAAFKLSMTDSLSNKDVIGTPLFVKLVKKHLEQVLEITFYEAPTDKLTPKLRTSEITELDFLLDELAGTLNLIRDINTFNLHEQDDENYVAVIANEVANYIKLRWASVVEGIMTRENATQLAPLVTKVIMENLILIAKRDVTKPAGKDAMIVFSPEHIFLQLAFEYEQLQFPLLEVLDVILAQWGIPFATETTSNSGTMRDAVLARIKWLQSHTRVAEAQMNYKPLNLVNEPNYRTKSKVATILFESATKTIQEV